VSPTIQQRAQVLSLHQVEGLSIRMVARMAGLSRFAVRSVLHETRRQDAPTMHPSSKDHIERPAHDVGAYRLREQGMS
jgi:transposase